MVNSKTDGPDVGGRRAGTRTDPLGAVRRGTTGYVANAVVTAARLVSSAELRQALTRYPDRDLALAVTARLIRSGVWAARLASSHNADG